MAHESLSVVDERPGRARMSFDTVQHLVSAAAGETAGPRKRRPARLPGPARPHARHHQRPRQTADPAIPLPRADLCTAGRIVTRDVASCTHGRAWTSPRCGRRATSGCCSSAGAVSYLGSMITYVALPFQVKELTDSYVLSALLGVVELVPLIVFGLWGGALADAIDRRRGWSCGPRWPSPSCPRCWWSTRCSPARGCGPSTPSASSSPPSTAAAAQPRRDDPAGRADGAAGVGGRPVLASG